jgi:ribonucleoside-diphosphate reductase alpha chain
MDCGPQTTFSDQLHEEKYRLRGETFKDSINRLVGVLADNDEHREVLKSILMPMKFMPAGRIQAQVGTTKMVTAMNCAVSGTIRDSFADGAGNIMQRATEAARTMRMGCGIGYDFSTLRPRGSWIGGINAQASGPVDFMSIFDAVCKCTSSSGNRRGAQMGVLRVDHPDIEEFIRAKRQRGALEGFNISVGATHEFMRAVEEDTLFALRWEGSPGREIRARDLWEQIMRSTWEHAEPGVLFLDTINGQNNLNYCEHIVATNPCGEQPLPPYGTCLLGSFNLVKYIKPGEGGYKFDLTGLREDIPHIVRMMDNVVDNTPYPLPEQRDEARAKRRMGLGVTGAANAGEALGFPYGSPKFCMWLSSVMAALRNGTYRASARLAEEKGKFPAYREDYLHSKFVTKLPADVRALIKEHGIRNSHLVSIAPTGTISLCADNVSSGIEPTFSIAQTRTIKDFEGAREAHLVDYGSAHLGVDPVTADKCSVDDHLNVLDACATYVDSAISKTCVVPSTMPWEDFKEVYMRAWKIGAKGITTYTDGGGREGILSAADEEAPAGMACLFDPKTGERSCE